MLTIALLYLSAVDVIHVFALPAINTKSDIIPARISNFQVLFEYAGIFRGQCSELCGALHGFMPLGVIAVDFGHFIAFYGDQNLF